MSAAPTVRPFKELKNLNYKRSNNHERLQATTDLLSALEKGEKSATEGNWLSIEKIANNLGLTL